MCCPFVCHPGSRSANKKSPAGGNASSHEESSDEGELLFDRTAISNLSISRTIAIGVLAGLLLCGDTGQADEDWPMWRANAGRTAAMENTLPSEFQLQWSVHLGRRKQAWDDPLNLDLMTYDRVLEPIVFDDLVCVGFNDQDKLVALDAATGATRWTYYTEAPVRLPPVGWNHRVYFCSDDGYLYCVNAADGSLHWKFRGAPNSQHAIGNQRLTSAWPARGGPVVYDGNVYFAASIWPFMGTFLYALDAETGDVRWLNDRTGAEYIKQPHSAPSFAGVAPQGALVATQDHLIVPGGRSVPAVFDRHTGALKHFELNAGGKGTGGSFVTADELHYYVHTREKGTRAFHLANGVKTAFTPNEPVISDGVLYSAELVEGLKVLRAYHVANEKNTQREPLWELDVPGLDELLLAGEHLIAADNQHVSIVRIPTTRNGLDVPKLVRTLHVECLGDEEKIVRVLVATKRLWVVGDGGTIAALGDTIASPQSLPASAKPATDFVDHATQATAESLLKWGDAAGFAFWFGRADEPRLWALAQHSPFIQLAVVDANPRRVEQFRRRLDQHGLLGRVTAHVSTPEEFRAPQYVANMTFVTSEVTASKSRLQAIYASVRPYGGALVILDEQDARVTQAMQLEKARCQQVVLASGQHAVVVYREGALPGAADWTHQYGNVANTVKSDDQRVKLPLGVLWFGGSSNMDVLPRHGHGPPEQVVGGRLFIQGMNSLSARDVYTGRVLWKREFEDLGTFDVYYDATYENTPLDPKYNQAHIPGANGRGTNYVVTEDCVYLVIGDSCLMLDPATGQDRGKIVLPANEDGSQPEWGYLGVYEHVLLGGIGFANYRQRHELEFEEDKALTGNRAGFGAPSLDRAASRGLMAFDRHTGTPLWRLDALHSFWHNGIVAGGGRVYCLDKNPTKIEQAMRRRGLALPDSYRIVAVGAARGDVQWEVREGVFGTWLGYSSKHNLLLQAGAQAGDRLTAEVGQGMRVYRADTGELHWKKDALRYAGPCILHNDLIITNANSYTESAGAFYLTTGEQRMVKHPLTGQMIPWTMTRAYGCNNIIASENMLTFRSGAAGYYDLTTDGGTGNLGGFKSGCTSNLVVANGVLNAPDYTRTCSCSYQNQTSLALVHMPSIEVWSVNALATAVPERSGPDDPWETSIDSIGFNFGAAGDRYDEQGILWLEYPAKAGDSPPFELQYNADAQVFSQHAVSRGDDPRAWITASGLDSIREMKIDLHVLEPVDLEKGLAVAHPDDDAEESEAGDVDITSGGLELAENEGLQTIGLRFDRVPLPRGSQIREAYLQFECHEATEESTDDAPQDTTSLLIAGELSPYAKRFLATSHDITRRTRTAAEIAWTPPAWKKTGDAGDAQRSPDIRAIVQEIIAQPDWKADSAMAFLLSGQGKRTAVAKKYNSQKATKLVVLSDVPQEYLAATESVDEYEVELVFAAPRESSGKRVFDVYLQDQLVAADVTVSANDEPASPPTVVTIPRVPIAKTVQLRFVSKQGEPALSGMRLKRQ